MPSKRNLFGLTLPELEADLTKDGYERYRASQLFLWIYNRRVTSFEGMTNIPKSLRTNLAASYRVEHPKIELETRAGDGTGKFLLLLEDGRRVESVLIPSESEEKDQPKRLTLCLSTQVGCPLDCVFCATASMKLKRNLSVGEIVGQYSAVQSRTARRITNLVFMGMGEPLLNYDNVMKAVEIITHETTCGVSSSRITVSTAGMVDGIRRMADERRKIKLAISLHSADDAVRSRLMPINRKYSLEAIREAANHYYRATRRRITYEYILFDGLNDTPGAIAKLVRFLRHVPSKLNVIPFHDVNAAFPDGLPLPLRPSPARRMEEFVRRLRERNITVMIRSSSGMDIDAACGQLAVRHEA